MAYYGTYEGGRDGDWVNLISVYAAASAKVILIQNRRNSDEAFVVFGGAKPVALDEGIELTQNDVIWGSGTAVWVRGNEGVKLAIQDKE